MKVFLSWSGSLSKLIAKALSEWLPFVIQAARPFISSGITKGSRWNEILTEELQGAEFGIICVTPYNIECPWLNYEAGALSNAIHTANVSPFLYLVSPSDVRGPLSQFQVTVYDTIGEDVLNLVFSVNQKLSADLRVSQDVLRETFKQWWPRLRDQIAAAYMQAESETRSGYSWLLTLQEIVQVPTQYQFQHVFIVSGDLRQHTMTTHCQEFLRAGLEKEVKFDFFFSSADAHNEEAQKWINGKFDRYQDQLRFFPINDEDFRRQAVTDYIIMNPELQSENQVAFIEVPCADCDRWIKVDELATAGFAARFNDLLKQELGKQTP
jgi:hypothetical protein